MNNLAMVVHERTCDLLVEWWWLQTIAAYRRAHGPSWLARSEVGSTWRCPTFIRGTVCQTFNDDSIINIGYIVNRYSIKLLLLLLETFTFTARYTTRQTERSERRTLTMRRSFACNCGLIRKPCTTSQRRALLICTGKEKQTPSCTPYQPAIHNHTLAAVKFSFY